MKKFIIFLIFSLIGLTYFAQNAKIDSLLNVLKTAKEDTNKVNTLNHLGMEFTITGDYEQAKKQVEYALILVGKLNFKKGKVNTYNVIGFIYEKQGNNLEALKNYFAALKIREEIGDKQGIANSYGNIGKNYWYQGNYQAALKNQFYSLKIKKEIGDKKGIAATYNDIGIIYLNQGNYDEALKNYFASLKICEEIIYKQGIADSYSNIGMIYEKQDKDSEAIKKQFASLKIYEKIGNKTGIANCYGNISIIYEKLGNHPEALKNQFASLKIKEKFDDKFGAANSYNNIGVIYLNQGNYPEALKNFFASLKIEEEIGDNEGIAVSCINIGSIYIKLKKLVEAKKQFEKAFKLSTEMGSKEIIKESYNYLAILDSAEGNWKDAYKHHKLFIIYRDSLDNKEIKEKILQASMSYEFDKKVALTKAEQDKKDALAVTEIKKQQIIRYGVSVILVLVILFTVFLYNRFRLIRKQKQIIELKEKETQIQKHLVDEKQKEIIESITYAKRLQEAILPPQAFIDKHIKDNFILYKPKDLVAGDFYWAESVNNLFFIAAADSTGHGVPGAMVSVVCSNALNRTIKEFKETEPGKILDKTRELVLETFEKSASEVKDGMDISLLCIDSKNKTIFWSGAHNSLWYITSSVNSSLSVRAESRTENKELYEIKADKQPIGKTEYPKPFVTHQIEYKEGTTFYLFTDGYADQFGGPNGKKFMAKNFKQVLLANSHLPLLNQKKILEQTFNNWVGDLEQVDDVCVIGIRV